MMSKQASSDQQKLNFFRFSMIFLGLSLLIFVLTATFFALFFLSNVEESFDIRQQASTEEEVQANVSTYPPADSIYKVAEKDTLSFFANTKNQDFTLFDWRLELVSHNNLIKLNDLEIEVANNSGLKLTAYNWTEELLNTTDLEGYYDQKFSTQLKFEVIDQAKTFNTHNEDLLIFKLHFTPQKEGRVQVSLGGDEFKELTTNYYVSNNGIDVPQCQYYYTAWSECENNWQNRAYRVLPQQCQWHDTEVLEELSRECQVNDGRGGIVANPNYFYLYTFEKCLNYPNEGEDIYILWDEDQYQNIAWIDVSRSNDFKNYYHKSAADAYSEEGMLIINAEGFTGATNEVSGQKLSFQPDQKYYFRLYDDKEEQHISSVRFYMGYCSGDQSEYLNCNDRCGEGTDNPERACAEGLACIDGQCRLESNPTNNWCLAEGQIGIGMPSRACNEYCADSSDCASHLSCYWNHCRLPSNLSDSQCLTASQTTVNNSGTGGNTIASGRTDSNDAAASQLPSEAYDLTTYGCNQGCNTNRDCEANYRCYQGKCRLASNPESASCDINDVVVDVSLDQAGSDSADLDLLDDENYQNPENNQQTTTAAAAATLEPNATNWLDQIKDLFTNQDQRQAMWQTVQNNFNWQWLALAGFLVIIAISLIFIGLNQKPKELKERLNIDSLKQTAQKKETNQKKELEIPENKPTSL